MIFKNTYLLIGDNTGPKTAKCLNIKKKKIGFLSDILTVAIKKKYKKKKKLKKNILNSILLTCKKKTRRIEGSFLRFKKNKIAILDDKFNFSGTNLKSLLCKEIKKNQKKNLKLLAYSVGII